MKIFKQTNIGLHFCGFLSLLGYGFAVFGLRGTGAARDVWAFILLFAGLFALYFTTLHFTTLYSINPRLQRGTTRLGTARHILWWALLFRLMLLPAGLPLANQVEHLKDDVAGKAVTYRTFLLYDNDVWRYLWDGHVSAAGFDPYAQSPADWENRLDAEDPVAEELFDSPWDDLFDRVYFKDYTTVYPPVAQLLFRLLHGAFPGSVFAFKLTLAMFDFGTCLLLLALLRKLGGPPAAVLIYAWNPLVLKEIAGSGHIDGLMIFFLTLATYWTLTGHRRAGLLAYGLSILSKLTPILLVGLFLRRNRPQDWPILVLTGVVGYLPYWQSLPDIVQGIRAFAKEWVFNPGPWALWRGISQHLGFTGRAFPDLLSLALTLALIAWVLWKDDKTPKHFINGSFLILGGYVVLSATVMPWYLLWALPFAALRPVTLGISYAWLVLTCLSLLSYLIYIDQIEHTWWLWTEFLIFFALLVWELRTRRSAKLGAAS